MADIATKMREWAKFGYGHEASQDMIKAAAEIEQLRAALEPFAEMGRVMMGRRHHMEAVIQYGLARTVKVHHLIAAHEARAALGGENDCRLQD
jgi:hypothetical protein